MLSLACSILLCSTAICSPASLDFKLIMEHIDLEGGERAGLDGRECQNGRTRYDSGLKFNKSLWLFRSLLCCRLDKSLEASLIYVQRINKNMEILDQASQSER